MELENLYVRLLRGGAPGARRNADGSREAFGFVFQAYREPSGVPARVGRDLAQAVVDKMTSERP